MIVKDLGVLHPVLRMMLPDGVLYCCQTISISILHIVVRLLLSAATVSFLDAIRWVMGKACALLSCGKD